MKIKVCECGKLLKAYTEKQLENITKKHQSGREHRKRLKEIKEIKGGKKWKKKEWKSKT